MTREEILQADDDRNPLALANGALLEDQFRIGRVLGAGGFGITYLAFDEVLEVAVAVKEYFPQHLAVDRTSEQAVQPRSTVEKEDFRFGLERFLEEARTLAKFQDHPNIVRVRTFFEENGTGYLVMSYYEGRTLEAYAEQRNGRIAEPEALYVMHALLDGLETVHAEGILHRDVDPSNIYLADKGHVVLLDFGAARNAMGDRTQTLSVMLKQGYAPHEQYHSHGNQGPWTDVYACAATLYRVLTGYKPPEATARVMAEEIVEPREVAPGISETTNDAILKGLAVNPDDRPQSVADFRALLPDRPDTSVTQWTSGEFDVSTGDFDGQAVVRVSADRACRLYVDGAEAASLDPDTDAPTVLNLEAGAHRLRAVRTDPVSSAGGTATVTSAGDSSGTASPPAPDTAPPDTSPETEETSPGETGPKETSPEQTDHVSVDDLIWQDRITVSTESPTDVEIAFGGEPDARNTAPSGATAAPTDPPVSDGSPTGEAGAVEEGGFQVGDADDDSAVQPASAPEPTPPADRGAGGDDRDAAADDDGGDDTTRTALPIDVTQDDRTVIGSGVAVLIVVGIVAWWIGFNEAPRPAPDRVVATGTAGLTTDVVANDRDPDGTPLVLQGVSTLADSVGRAERVDSARVRFEPAPGFAGTARIRYTVADASGATAEETLTVVMPFSGRAEVVSRSAGDPQTVVSDDLDGDGDRDLLAAAYTDNAVVVYPNRGADGGPSRFDGEAIVLDDAAGGAVDVQTADLDGDNDPDVLATALQDDAVYWYENVGTAALKFQTRRTITTAAGGAVAARPADVNGDGRTDVVVAARNDRQILWYPNRGSAGTAQFGDPRVVADSLNGLESIAVDDFDDDGDPDVVSAAYGDGTVAWHENQEDGFSTRVIDGDATEVLTVYVDDLNGDGNSDVLAGLGGSDRVVWYAQQSAADAPSRFAEPQLITDAITDPEVVRTADVDTDGDADLVTASFNSGIVAWRANQGDGTFGPRLVVASDAREALDVHATDLDGDDDADLVSASQADDTIAWYRNAMR